MWNGEGQSGQDEICTVSDEPLHMVFVCLRTCVLYSLWNEDRGKVKQQGVCVGGDEIINH